MTSITLHKSFHIPSHWRYGIVRHNPKNAESHQGGIGSFLPDVIFVQDRPIGASQGEKVRITPAWWRFIHLLNPAERDWQRTLSIDAMWINIIWSQDPTKSGWGDMAKAERLTNGGNFVLIDGMTSTHFHLVSMSPYLNTDHLDIRRTNWHITPWLFFKECMIDVAGTIRNPGQAQEVYYPFLRGQNVSTHIEYPDSWLPQSAVEVFPSLPYRISTSTTIIEYLPQGCSVLGRTDKDEWIYLLQSRFAGERVFPTSWHLDTLGVVPPYTSYEY